MSKKGEYQIPKDLPPGIPDDAYGPPPEKTYPCKICGRNFVKATLQKHEPVCKKVTTKKRKTFDSGVQRAGQGSDVTLQGVQKSRKELEKNQGHFKPPKSNWKEQHENFVGAVRSAKHVDYALKTGAPLPPPPKAVVPSDYVKCEHCGRNFNASAAERHIPFCKDQKSRTNARVAPPPKGPMQAKRPAQPPPGRQPVSNAKRGGASQPSRTTYQPPKPVGKTPPPNRPPAGGSAGQKKSGIPGPAARHTNSAPRARSVDRESNSGKMNGNANRGRSPVGRATNDMRKMNVRK